MSLPAIAVVSALGDRIVKDKCFTHTFLGEKFLPPFSFFFQLKLKNHLYIYSDLGG
jgi:hypothetical protein